MRRHPTAVLLSAAKGMTKGLAWLAAAVFGIPAGTALALVVLGLLVVFGIYGAFAPAVATSSLRTPYFKAAEAALPPVSSADGTELEHRLPWGLLYAVDWFTAQVTNRQVNYAAENAAALAPVFEYRPSTITREIVFQDEQGNWVRETETQTVNLVSRAATYRGIYTYRYRQYTSGSETKEIRAGVDFSEDWTPLKNLLADRFSRPVPPIDLLLVVRAGEAFTAGQPHFTWLQASEEEMWTTAAVGWDWKSTSTGPGLAAASIVWPLTGRITDGFGPRTHPLFGYRAPHTGVDIAAAFGAPVRAASAGTVRFAGTAHGYGLTVVLDHGSDWLTLYGHNQELFVHAGDQVAAGDVIALAGSSGWSTGPHLHFEVRHAGKPVDPSELARKEG